MKKLILASLVTLFTTQAFAQVVCQTEDMEYSIVIATGDINKEGIAPVNVVSVMRTDYVKKTDQRFLLDNLSGGYTSYDSGIIQGEALGNYYRISIKSMNMHVLTPKNDSSLRIKSKNGRVRMLKLTCMTDGD